MRTIFENPISRPCCQPYTEVVEPFVNDAFGNWFAGFVDGEGSFVIRYQKGKHRPVLQLNLREDDIWVLIQIQTCLQIGNRRPYREEGYVDRNGHFHKPTARWHVQSAGECRHLADIFDRFPLRSKKLRDYGIWREAVFEYCSPHPNQARLASLKAQLEAGRKYARPTVHALY